MLPTSFQYIDIVLPTSLVNLTHGFLQAHRILCVIGISIIIIMYLFISVANMGTYNHDRKKL